MNTVNLVGRIGNDLELQMTSTGKPTTRLSLAVRRNKEVTDWFNLVAYNTTAENIVQYFTKGDLIGISGQLFTDSYEKDGKKISNTRILVQEYTFCNGAKKDNQEEAHVLLKKDKEVPVFNTGKMIEITDDDLPF